MKNTYTYAWQLSILAALFLSACTVNYQIDWSDEPVPSLDRETTDLADIANDALALAEKKGNERVLMVFDIDNTILAMEQGLGSDQWYEWQKELAKHDSCNQQNVGDRFAAQGAIYFASAMRPTQDDAAMQVKAIQEAGIPVIALTSRGQDYRLQTFRELRRNGFRFYSTSIGPIGGYAIPFIPVENGRMSRYEDGVFLTAGQHKGEMLRVLIEKTGTPMPDVIVMADDKQKNLDAIKESFDALDVPVRAWRYAGEDDNVARFDTEKAYEQWQSIEASLRQIQEVLGPDNYDMRSAILNPACQ